MYLLPLIFIIAISLLIRGLYEPFAPELDFCDLDQLQLKPLAQASPKELNAEGKINILFFSDLHAGFNPISLARLKKIIKHLAKHADLCIFAGDLANNKRTQKQGLIKLSVISAICRHNNIPCLAVRGNHDQNLSQKDFAKAGFKLLQNQSYQFKDSRQQAKLLIVGLEDLKLGQQIIPNNNNSQLTSLLLAHNPDSMLHPKAQTFDYGLAGHFHGGQIYLPWHLEFKLIRSEKLARFKIYKGANYINNIKCFISRGVGCVLIPLRFLSKPEFTLVKINVGNKNTPLIFNKEGK